MGWYEIAKVVHFIGLIPLFGFFVVYARAGIQLRAATTRAEARTWLGLLEATRGMLLGGAGMLLLSGGAMAALRWRGVYPFIVIGLVTLLAIWLIWVVVGARHLRAMRAAVGDGDDALGAEPVRTILAPTRWGMMGALNGASLAVLFVMTTKIDWPGAIITVLLVASLAGGIFTALAHRRRGAVSRRQARVVA
ncbi:hypothetical protein [Ramlibacter sp.]|uniref:hypothetical protein n=1 Tax=Ramlibacter sp. TaxID=1917967 RepID=UPI001822613D|nr:hypothetical protein [Ramlibacter sp.]MBA2672306.1 hypothetical protein [Ramlibacter sp.]